MIKFARFSEMAIVYGNRYRSDYPELDKHLSHSEALFFSGEYQKSLDYSVGALSKVEPGIYNKLIGFYESEKN